MTIKESAHLALVPGRREMNQHFQAPKNKATHIRIPPTRRPAAWAEAGSAWFTVEILRLLSCLRFSSGARIPHQPVDPVRGGLSEQENSLPAGFLSAKDPAGLQHQATARQREINSCIRAPAA
jgi:hypothetical protein